MNHKLKVAKNRELLKNYLKNKRVVVVGPAPSIVNSKQRDLIDSYDVVVRLNRAVPLPDTMKLDIGTRTDILYNCMNPSNECGGKIDVQILRQNGVKFIVSPYAPIQTNDRRFQRFKSDIDNFLESNLQDDLQFSHFDVKYFIKLLKIMKLPNTGINAILDLLTFEIKELYITGFTFFKGGYYPAYRNYNEEEVMERMERHKLHNQEKQFAYMKKVLLGDKRVKMDTELNKIVHSNTMKFIKPKINQSSSPNRANMQTMSNISKPKKIKTHLIGNPNRRNPLDKPSGKPSDKPNGKPLDKPNGKPSDKPSGKPMDKPNGKPSDKPNGKPSDKPNGKPMDKPSGKPMDKPSGKPMDKPSGKPMDKPNRKPFNNKKKINPPKNKGRKIKIGAKNYLVKNKGNRT